MKRTNVGALSALAFFLLAATAFAKALEPVPYRVPAKLQDAAEMLSPAAVRVGGWLGARVDANESKRLLVVDTEPLLAGFRKKPGSHPWIGEHVGKWLHAATLAWANTGDTALREKLDHVAADLIATQEPVGYLGTYLPEQRFGLFNRADWDVWSHKYNLIGLLTYHQFTGNDTVAHIGETCVTTTWIQFNLQLLRLTGEAKFGDELERTFYNHLAAAQHPLGHDWCYYTALEGHKPYDKGISCCHSSGPRGMALVPQAAYLASRDALLVSTFETSSATLQLGGQRVTVEQQSQFPRRGESVLTLRLAKPATFAVKIRAPAWAAPLTMKSATVQSGWAMLPAREWKDGDRIAIKFNLAARLVAGECGNAGRAALTWGPFVLAYDQKLNPDLPAPGALGLLRVNPGLGFVASPQPTKPFGRNMEGKKILAG